MLRRCLNNAGRTMTLVLLLSSFGLQQTCIAPFDNSEGTPPQDIDRTKLEGLSIYGELIIFSHGEEGPAYHGALELDLLHATVVSQCVDELWGVEAQESPVKSKCMDLNNACLSSVEPSDLDKRCRHYFCRSELSRCVSFKYIELADAVAETTFVSEPFQADVSLLELWGSYVAFDMRPNDTRSPKHIYRIPPLAPRSKSIAYLLALDSLNFAARNSHYVMSSWGAGDNNCIDVLAVNEAADTVSAREMLTFGFGETVFQFGNVTKKLVENQINVATSKLADIPDYSKAQDEMWTEGFNSHFGALRVLLNRRIDEDYFEPATPDPPLCGCPVALKSRGQKNALELLRSTTLSIVYDELFTTRQVIEAVVTRVDPNAPNPPGAYVDDFLYERRLSESDFSLARQYLNDESKAMSRIHTEMGDKTYGMHRPTFQNPPAYYTKWAYSGNPFSHVTPDSLYANMGAVQAVDYFREIAISTMLNRKTSLTDEQFKHLGSAAMVAESLVGKKRVTSRFVESDFPALLITVNGVSQKESDIIVLYNDESAYRCAVEGTIDGAPCSTSDLAHYEVGEESRKWIETDGGPRFPLDSRCELTYDWETVAGKGNIFYLVTMNGLGMSELLAVIRPDDQVIHKHPVIRQGTMHELVQRVVSKSPDCCSLPEKPCGDIPYARSYVPALENELIADADDAYESSWRFYLSRAKASAEKTDRLGEDLVLAGLKIDQTSEEARSLLEGECGGLLDLDPFDVMDSASVCDDLNVECNIVTELINSNPTLKSCLPAEWGGGEERIPYANLGSDKLCTFYNLTSGKMCDCDANDPCEDVECPQVMDVDSDCTGIFFIDGHSNYKLLPLMHPLRAFEIPFKKIGESVESATCDEEELTNFILDVNRHFGDQENGGVAIAADLVRNNPMLEDSTMSNLLKRIKFNEDLLWHYELRFDGNVIWSTFVNEVEECPREPPWSDETSPNIACVKSGGGSLAYPGHPAAADAAVKYGWLEDEVTNGTPIGRGRVRREWGEKMLKRLLAMGLISGNIGSIRIGQGVVGATGNHCHRREPYETLGTEGDNMWPFLPMYLQSDGVGGLGSVYCLTGSPGVVTYESFMWDYDNLSSQTYYIKDPGLGFCYNEWYSKHWHAGHAHYHHRYRYYYRKDTLLNLRKQDSDDGWRQFYDNLDSFMSGAEYSNAVSDVGFIFVNGDSNWLEVEHDPANHRLLLRKHPDLREQNWPFSVDEVEITNNDIFEGLQLACYLKNKAVAVVDQRLDAGGVFPIFTGTGNIERDVLAMRDYVASLHRQMMKAFSTAVILELPAQFANGYVTGDMTNLYGTYKGNNLTAVSAIADGLNLLSSSALGLDFAFSKIVMLLDTMLLGSHITDTQEAINDLEKWRSVMSNTANAFTSISQGLSSLGSANLGGTIAGFPFAAALCSFAAAACHTALIGLDCKISDLKGDLITLGSEKGYKESLISLADQMSSLWTYADQIEKAYRSIQTGINGLDAVQKNATNYLAKYLILDSDGAERAMHSNTVTRRMYNTLKFRYEKALKAAKADAFLAKRAIEFRIGADLTDFEEPLGHVEPPSQWADEICKMQGFDYRSLREANPSDPLYSELSESEHYGSWYIGDYVQKLDDFIVGYVNKHPFSDEDDIAVLSLKNDIMHSRGSCDVPSRNRLTYTDAIGYSKDVVSEVCEGEDCTSQLVSFIGWKTANCEDGTSTSLEMCDNNAAITCEIKDDCLHTDSKSSRITDARPALAGNLLQDGNMESTGTSSWTASNATLAKIEADPPGQPQESLSRTLRITRTVTTGSSYAQQGVLTGNRLYRITGWARGDVTAEPQLSLGSTVIWTGSSSADWQRIAMNVQYDATNGSAVKLEAVAGVVGSYVEFDNVSVVEVLGEGYGYSVARTTDSTSSGYVVQTVPDLDPGYYVLSWWDKHPDDNSDQPVRYAIAAYDETEEYEYSWDEKAEVVGAQHNETRRYVAFEKYDSGSVEIKFFPSLGTSTLGDVQILRVQLERVGEWEQMVGTDPFATAYTENTDSTTYLSNDCPDVDGQGMRGNFSYHCICVNRRNNICLPHDRGTTNEQCYWEYPIDIKPEMLEQQGILASGGFALGNFNYRQGKVAVNVVGTNVIDCESSPTPSTCYANAYLQYTLRHEGVAGVKNHNNVIVDFTIPAARIEHAKALAAEVLVTNPMGNTATQLLADYWKTGLQGRPLQGTYRLRIWDTAGIRWRAIEDIQLIYRYRYWTPME